MNENKKIAYNTIIVYLKLLLSTIIGLYTSRVLLHALGASDYGLYNVVGGIVVLLNTIAITMGVTSQRYISVEIGKKEKGNIRKVFNTVFVVHLALAIGFIVLCGLIGTIYCWNGLNVEEHRRPDAVFVLWCSLLTAALAVVSFPCQGMIIAREKFLFQSIIELSQRVGKLLIIVLIVYDYKGNRLRIYALLIALLQALQPLCYYLYCRINENKSIKWQLNKKIKDYLDIAKYTGWLLVSSVAFLAREQGCAVVINFFFGTLVNAAYGVALQVQSCIQLFVKGVAQATAPQIMKNVGGNNDARSLMLVYKISKFCFLIMLTIAIPVIVSIKEILVLWLGKVPQYTDIFICLLLFNGLILCLNSGFDNYIQATGRVKKNQIGYSFINIMVLPITIIGFKCNFPCYTAIGVMAILSVFTVIFQCHILQGLSNFKIATYWKLTLFPCLKTLLLSLPVLVITFFYPSVSVTSFLINSLVTLVWCLGIILVFGLDKEEFCIIKKVITKSFVKSLNKI